MRAARCVAAGGLLLLSCLVWHRAPSFTGWYLAIVATELAHLLALGAALVIAFPARGGVVGRIGTVLGAVAGIVFAFGAGQGWSGFRAGAEGAAVDMSDALSPFATRRPAPRVLLDDNCPPVHVWPAEGKAPHPLVLMVHSGGWTAGNPVEKPGMARHLASLGYTVASVEYRLAPTHRWPVQVEDVVRAARCLRRGTFGIDLNPTQLVIVGRSAGAHIGLAAAQQISGVRGFVGLYGIYDLAAYHANPADDGGWHTHDALKALLGAELAEAPDRYRDASPIHGLDARAPPSLLLHGGRDELVPPAQTDALAEALSKEGVPVEVHRMSWATHGCDVFIGGPCGQLVRARLEAFLRRTLGR